MIKINKYSEVITGAAFLIFALVYLSQIPGIRHTDVALVDSSVYPKIMAAGLLILSIAHILLSLNVIRLSPQSEATEKGGNHIDFKCVLFTLCLSLIYVLLLQPVGFLISSAVYLFFQMIAMCPKEEIKPVKFAIISIAAAFVIYYVFRSGLKLMLPAGILNGIL